MEMLMESDESRSENSQSDQETDNLDNCLHCGEVHQEEDEEEEEEQQREELEQTDLVNRTDQQLTHCKKAQTCDILDRNLYLRRMFVMPNSFMVSSPSPAVLARHIFNLR